MRGGIPIPGTTRARLLDEALVRFGRQGYDAVSVTELAEAVGVTIGSLYHHFGSKLGLYTAVRGDVEQRVVDRMAGAAAISTQPLADALLVGFDYLVRVGYARMLGEPQPEPADDRVARLIHELAAGAAIGRLLLATWREALLAAAESGDRAATRDALSTVVHGIC